MFYILVLINTLLYGLYCYLGYVESFKNSAWFTPACLSIVLVGNFMWIYYVKSTNDPNQIFVSGLIWDALLTASFTLVPFIFFNVKLNKYSMIGFVLCLIGLGLLKGGDLIEKKLNEKENVKSVDINKNNTTPDLSDKLESSS